MLLEKTRMCRSQLKMKGHEMMAVRDHYLHLKHQALCFQAVTFDKELWILHWNGLGTRARAGTKHARTRATIPTVELSSHPGLPTSLISFRSLYRSMLRAWPWNCLIPGLRDALEQSQTLNVQEISRQHEHTQMHNKSTCINVLSMYKCIKSYWAILEPTMSSSNGNLSHYLSPSPQTWGGQKCTLHLNVGQHGVLQNGQQLRTKNPWCPSHENRRFNTSKLTVQAWGLTYRK